MTTHDPCPDLEQLAEYVDRVLPASDRRDIEQHLVRCEHCRTVVTEAAVFASEHTVLNDTAPQTGPVMLKARRWWVGSALAAAAVIMIAVVLAPSRPGPSVEEQLIAALAEEPTRAVHGRLTGGFRHGAPPRARRPAGLNPIRGTSDLSAETRIALAEAEQRIREDESADGRALLGVIQLIDGSVDAAVALLKQAVAASPNNPRFWSDLAAAYVARGSLRGTADDYAEARAAADTALILNPNASEAAFNRALAIEAIASPSEAVAAWKEARRLDPLSEWGREAAEKIDLLTQKP